MGYLFFTHAKDKTAFVEECITELKRHYEVSDHSLRGNQLWMIVKRQDKEPIIALYLLASQGGCWGYTDMAEEDHPYYYSCPLNFLKKVPVMNQSWRDKVKEFHAQKAASRTARPKVNDMVILPADNFPEFSGTYQVVRDLGRKGLEITKNGMSFRLSCRQLSLAQLQGA